MPKPTKPDVQAVTRQKLLDMYAKTPPQPPKPAPPVDPKTRPMSENLATMGRGMERGLKRMFSGETTTMTDTRNRKK